MFSFSKIFERIRIIVSSIPIIRKPFLCPECSSFWFGIITSFLFNPIKLDYNIFLLTNIFCGLVTHLFACFLYKKEKSNSINFVS